MSRHSTPDLDYIRKLYAPQDALLARIDRTLKDMGSGMHIGAEEGKLLQLLIKLHGVKTIVEIGTFAGYSTIWMARALPEGGHIYTIDREPKHLALARGFFAGSTEASLITQLEGAASDVLETLAGKGPFDMVFIDADKNNYNAYLDWSEEHVRAGGLIVADNTLLFGAAAQDSPPEGAAPATWHGMRLFNERLADGEKYFTAMIPTQEGLTVAVKLF